MSTPTDIHMRYAYVPQAVYVKVCEHNKKLDVLYSVYNIYIYMM